VIRLRNRTTGEVILDDVTVARTAWARTRGLLGRRSLAPECGLVLPGCAAIHTWFMRFPIDVLFLDRDGRVRRRVERLRPWRFALGRGGKTVIEMAAGRLADRPVSLGDELVLEDEGESEWRN